MPVTAPTKSRSVPGSKTVNTAPLHTGEAQDNLAAKLLCCGIGSYSYLDASSKSYEAVWKRAKNRLFLANDICGYYSTDMKDSV